MWEHQKVTNRAIGICDKQDNTNLRQSITLSKHKVMIGKPDTTTGKHRNTSGMLSSIQNMESTIGSRAVNARRKTQRSGLNRS